MLSVVRRAFVGVMEALCTGSVIRLNMARPQVDDDVLEMASECIDAAVQVPLDSDNLSANQQLRIIVEATYDELEREDLVNTVDREYAQQEKEALDIEEGNNESKLV